MSDDLYSQIIQQINTIYSSCKLPRFNIEEYKINRKLGEGSYGIIHCIIKEDTKEKYALKKIIAQSLQKVSEFVKEFELVNLCQHSNILKIYGLNINLLEHSTYSIQVLMEKAERDWNKDIKRRKQEEKYYTEKELLSIMKQLTLALLYMKEKLNIAHRDIKPQNVLIFENGVYKLADFGEAKEIKLNKEVNTLRGTELYMSPALYYGLKDNKDDIEHDPFKSDLFSLGFCFVYAATMDFNLIYDLRNINNDEEMGKKLNEYLKNRYSEKFIWIVSKMVVLNEKNRFDFKELNSEIDKIIKNEEN
jgi:serine/threonine protein kinase